MTTFVQKNGAIRVTVTMDRGAIDRLDRRGSPVDFYVRKKADQTATVARQIVKVKTGRLRDSVQVQQARSVDGRFGPGWDVAANAPYAAAYHQGTKPHLILPVNASVLVFQVGGATVYAKRVNHPGTKGDPFLLNAARVVVGKSR